MHRELPGTALVMTPHDPYMRDPNIRGAANVQRVGWPAILAATGAAASGWFEFPAWLGIGGGAVLGILIATVLLRAYGGRATR
jgi:hypothetical protein